MSKIKRDVLLKALDGKWEGTGEELVCLGATEAPEEEIDEFSIASTVKMSRSGQFAFKSTLESREKREKRHETIRLHYKQEAIGHNGRVGGIGYRTDYSIQ